MPIVNGYQIRPGANLTGANLHDADLTSTNLVGADLGEAKASKTNEDGAHVNRPNPAGAKRSNATTCKCRAAAARVLEVIGADEGVSTWNGSFRYRADEVVSVPDFNEDRWAECSAGIHFFLTREEAEAWGA